ncbi:hypothetical protein [Kineococcus sp. SYSU DK005]|uniref:hypothetical protein n=1 Tax=Kineococcus sp. SYSU DK005 TaxID=3383126 RepID=UPI003D7CFFA1
MSSAISSSFDRQLGALVHGPCVLSAGPGIGIGLRCAFAHSDGLLLSIEVKAIGQAARDAYESDSHPGSRSGRRYRPLLPRSEVRLSVPASAAGTTPDGQPWLRLEHHSNSRAHTARGASGDGPGTPAYIQDLDVWWPTLPEDARLPLQAGWPELGAPMTTTVLQLQNLDQLAETVVRLE